MARSTIVVVEDDLLLRMETAAMLEDAGHHVVELANADDALAYIYEQAQEISGVFTDVHMPGHSDGLHVAEVISRHWPHIKVILTSGRTRPLCELPPGVHFIPKPWLLKDVLSVMAERQPWERRPWAEHRLWPIRRRKVTRRRLRPAPQRP